MEAKNVDCSDLMAFQDALGKMRLIDDKILFELNCALPSSSFSANIDKGEKCRQIHLKLTEIRAKRMELIRRCLNENQENVANLRKSDASPGDIRLAQNTVDGVVFPYLIHLVRLLHQSGTSQSLVAILSNSIYLKIRLKKFPVRLVPCDRHLFSLDVIKLPAPGVRVMLLHWTFICRTLRLIKSEMDVEGIVNERSEKAVHDRFLEEHTMKYLENANLERICSALSNNAIDCHLDMRLEAYSCKMVSSEKRQWKKNQRMKGQAPQPLSPPDQLPWPMSLSVSPLKSTASRFRHLSEPSCSGSDNDTDETGCTYQDAVTTRTLFDLIGVLNTSFPDYDFMHIKSESFSLIPNLQSLVGLVDLKLSATVANYYEIKEALWREIDEVINLSDCKLYSYQTEYSGDPFSEDGVMWSFSYFFSNKALKRVLFMSCRALRSDPSLNLSAEQLWGFEA